MGFKIHILLSNFQLTHEKKILWHHGFDLDNQTPSIVKRLKIPCMDKQIVSEDYSSL
jgi:hypothetical protein